MTSVLKQGDNIGIMDPAFFVSKTEILSWINTFFQVSDHFILKSIFYFISVECPED